MFARATRRISIVVTYRNAGFASGDLQLHGAGSSPAATKFIKSYASATQKAEIDLELLRATGLIAHP